MDILEFIKGNAGFVLVGAVTLIQIAPIKINPWSWLLRWIRAVLIGDIATQITELTKKVDDLDDKIDEREAVSARARIQRFGDEIFHNQKHSKDHFDGILIDIDYYEEHCRNHPKFRNNVTVATTKRIKDIYDDCLETNGFL